MNQKKIILDDEEQALLASFEAGEWTSVDDLDVEKKKAVSAAGRFFKKDARINIRISSSDLKSLKEKAAFEGMPYQTLVASILHKYAAGHL